MDKIHTDCINNNELQSVLNHIKVCRSCESYHNVMEQMLNDLSSFEEKQLPEGFHNKLHFALKRAAETPQKGIRPIVKGMTCAAVGAFSILLVIAAVTLLPGRKSMDAAMPNMAIMEEAAEQQVEAADMQVFSAKEATAEDLDLTSTADETREDDIAEAESQNSVQNESPFAYGALSNGSTIIIIIEANDIEGTYNALLEYITDPLPDTRWMLCSMDEPEEYMQLRTIMDALDAQYIAELIAGGYSSHIEEYYIQHLEYDEYQQETADLQNFGYVLIIIK